MKKLLALALAMFAAAALAEPFVKLKDINTIEGRPYRPTPVGPISAPVGGLSVFSAN